jgi:hypothetical protein
MDFCTWGSSMRRFAVLAGVLMLLALGVLPGQAEKRVGNDFYGNLLADQQLRTAVNDARAVGDNWDRKCRTCTSKILMLYPIAFS